MCVIKSAFIDDKFEYVHLVLATCESIAIEQNMSLSSTHYSSQDEDLITDTLGDTNDVLLECDDISLLDRPLSFSRSDNRSSNNLKDDLKYILNDSGSN